MRGKGRSSEIRRLATPIVDVLDGAWQRMHWWIATMALLYALSGICIVKSDEVAIILRWGRLVGDTPALQQHGPGLLFAFPRPMDQVVHVPVKHVWEIPVSTLNSVNTTAAGQSLEQTLDHLADRTPERTPPSSFDTTLDPLKQGYALTGDQNVVHAQMVARFRVRDPAEWAFYGPKAEDVLRVEVTAAMVRSLGEMGVDRVLADGRKTLIATAARSAQSGLDAAHSGLELSSLELTRLSPPAALARDFDAVQSAFIAAQTRQNEAQAFRQSVIPRARAEADAMIQTAQGAALSALAVAQGDADAFLALAREDHASPAMVRERLYRDALDRAIGAAGSIRWIPPPPGGRYHGLRITVGSSGRANGDAGSMMTGPQSGATPDRGDDEE